MSINDFLVKYFKISKKEAFQIIQEGRVLVNDTIVRQRQWVLKHEGIVADGVCIQEPITLQYFAYYKPRGIECTHNPDIPDNLRAAFPFDGHIFPIGRLDKQSEGLLLLTNDGKLYNRTALADAYKEKEYIVTVDNVLTTEALQQLASGVVILRTKLTRPAVVHQLSEDTFSIILTQGFNRQIRRMCHNIGYYVTSLKRTRITSVELKDLKPGEFRVLEREEIE